MTSFYYQSAKTRSGYVSFFKKKINFNLKNLLQYNNFQPKFQKWPIEV